MILSGLGPLDDELSAVASASLMKPLSRAERQEHARLGEELDRAVDAGDLERMAELHALRLVLFARGAFFSPEVAREFVDKYFAAGTHWKLNHRVNRIVSASYRKMPIWDGLTRVSASVLMLYGYQDFEPITQAHLIRSHIPQTRIRFLNRCGHMPWLEQPEAFYGEMEEFLAAGTSLLSV